MPRSVARPAFTPEQREDWQALVILTHLLEAELERQTQQDGGLPHSHFKILALLGGAPDYTMGLTKLGRALRFHKSRLSHALHKLESDGLVRRENTPQPGRSYQAVLTAAGLEVVLRVLPLQEAWARTTVLAGLSPEQVRQLRSIAETITTNLESH